MTIISKFPGKCTACGGHISAGTKIEWAKGQGARHVTCPSARTTSPKTKTSAPSAPVQSPAEIVASVGRTIALLDDGSGPVDKTLTFTRYGKGTAKLGEIIAHTRRDHADPDPYVIVEIGPAYYHSEEECEDQDCFCGVYGWRTPYEAIRVAPTAAETTAHETARAVKLARETAQKLVTSSLRWDAPAVVTVTDSGSRPAEAAREITWTDGSHVTYDVTATEIVRHDSGTYDDYRTSTSTLTRAGHEDVVEAIRTLTQVVR
jgi:hypothetical protein